MGTTFEDLNFSDAKNLTSSNNSELSLLGQAQQSSLPDVQSAFRGKATDCGLPPLSFDDELAKHENATNMTTTTDARGNTHRDYFVGSHRVFSDIKDQQGDRLRISYNMMGDVEGQRHDYSSGRSISQFKDDFCSYRIVRNQGALEIQSDESGEWKQVKDSQECTDVLNKERAMFAPPHVVARRAG